MTCHAMPCNPARLANPFTLGALHDLHKPGRSKMCTITKLMRLLWTIAIQLPETKMQFELLFRNVVAKILKIWVCWNNNALTFLNRNITIFRQCQWNCWHFPVSIAPLLQTSISESGKPHGICDQSCRSASWRWCSVCWKSLHFCNLICNKKCSSNMFESSLWQKFHCKCINWSLCLLSATKNQTKTSNNFGANKKEAQKSWLCRKNKKFCAATAKCELCPSNGADCTPKSFVSSAKCWNGVERLNAPMQQQS